MNYCVHILLICALGSLNAQEREYSKDTLLMGVHWNFTIVHDNNSEANLFIKKAIQEVVQFEAICSSWQATSQTSQINRSAGIAPVKVDDDLLALIERSIKLSKISNGYFDITFASINKYWNFDSVYNQLPDELEVQKSVVHIDYQNIEINKEETTVYLKDKYSKIGLGAIAKGAAAERAKKVLLDLGVLNGAINAGGDLALWGKKASGKPWNVGIADPSIRSNVLGWIQLKDAAIATSGNYEKFIEIGGKQYCHIINPKTGWPVDGLKSSTVICNDAELADALATTVFALGPTDGMGLINHLDGVEGVLITKDNRTIYSTNLKTKFIHYAK